MKKENAYCKGKRGEKNYNTNNNKNRSKTF